MLEHLFSHFPRFCLCRQQIAVTGIVVSSTWTVTGDSRLTSLHCAGTITDPEGNTVTVQGTDGSIYVQGSSSYTVTVDAYDNAADCAGASAAESWSDFAIARP